ncbi:helix-turn-helix domain-containing protein [Streptomyces sp. NPDC020192]|uniref:helix-turn-helix domain-containing protein n=1 Tax=Streptomyces sp. NPDC020192 TaxID=3365066 RepID=UPI0037AB738F
MTPVIDTTGFPDGGNSVRRWNRAVSKATVPVTVASYGAPPTEGRTTTRPLGHLLFVATDADPQCFTRSRRRIARDAGRTEAFVVVAVVGDTGAVLQQGGRTAELTAGTLALWDTERPHVVDFPRGVDIKACLVPRRALGVRDDELERVTATVIEADGPVAALLGPLLVTLAGTAVDCPEHVADRLARNFTDLVATLITERAAGDVADTAGSRYAQTREVRAYVDRRLGDPELGPETIAAAHSMSVRSLHKLFEGEGTTVSRLIQRRRLEECARDLARGDSGERTISGVARRWGFSSPAHFSRLFRTAYGMSPSRWRDTRGGAAPSDASAVVDGPAPAENDRMTPGALRCREKRDRGPSVAKRSKTGGLTCSDEATHGGLVGCRDLRDSADALPGLHADGELEPTVDLPSDVLADEAFLHVQATPMGAATGRRGPSRAPAGECGQEGA